MYAVTPPCGLPPASAAANCLTYRSVGSETPATPAPFAAAGMAPVLTSLETFRSTAPLSARKFLLL
eukprot:9448584-Pyramimonas_sp.AAC.1